MITLLFQYYTSLSSVATVQHYQCMEFTFYSVLMSSTVIFKTEEEFEDTKGVIKIRKSKKDRQHNGHKKRNRRTNNDLQNTTHKTKDRVTRTPLSTGCEIKCSGRVSSSCSSSDTSRVTLVTNLVISYERGQDPKMITESETYSSCVTQMFRNG